MAEVADDVAEAAELVADINAELTADIAEAADAAACAR